MNRFEIGIALVASTLAACAAGARSGQGNPATSSDAGASAPDAPIAQDASEGAPADASVAVDGPSADAPFATDPFDPASCPSPPITQAQLAAKFGSGATTTTLGNYTFAAERRYCTTQTGCTAWSVITAKIQLEDPPYTVYMGSAGTLTADAGSWFSFAFDFDAGGDLGNYGDGCNVAKPIDASPNISGCGTWDLRPTDVSSDWMAPPWSGILANDCARLTASTTADGYDYQWVILAQF
jgi:hypothetical protein